MWLGVWYMDKVMTYLTLKYLIGLQLMSQLFVPMLAREGARGEEAIFWFTDEQHMMEHIGNELMTNMQRFSSQVKPLTHYHSVATKTWCTSLYTCMCLFLFSLCLSKKSQTVKSNTVSHIILGFKCQRTNERRFAAGSSECSNRLLWQRGNRLRTYITSALLT